MNKPSDSLEITGVHRRRQSLYLLEIDGEEYDTIDKKTWDETGLGEGSVITHNELKKIEEDSVFYRGKNRGYYLLSVREHSSKEIERKLYGHAPPEVIEKVIYQLRDEGYLSDERYAVLKAKQLFERKNYPERRVSSELRSHGIDLDIICVAIEEAQSQDDVSWAKEQIRKKHSRKLLTDDGERRAAAALGRYGFSYDVVKIAIREWKDENGIQEV